METHQETGHGHIRPEPSPAATVVSDLVDPRPDGGANGARGRRQSVSDETDRIKTWTNASDVDIDHMVALAEAWGSGAKRWTRATRKRFANDLRDRRALVAVTDNVNQSKGDRDPAEWMPQYGQCRYLREWVAIKLRWSLKVNRAERRRLVELAGGCRNKSLRWTPARVVYR